VIVETARASRPTRAASMARSARTVPLRAGRRYPPVVRGRTARRPRDAAGPGLRARPSWM